MSWFSTKVRIACLIEGEGLSRYMDSVHLLIADDYEQAMVKAVSIGRKHEEEYLNAEGLRVRWRLKEVISLDALGDQLRDGLEVYSEPVDAHPNDRAEFEEVFAPENSTPTQTI